MVAKTPSDFLGLVIAACEHCVPNRGRVTGCHQESPLSPLSLQFRAAGRTSKCLFVCKIGLKSAQLARNSLHPSDSDAFNGLCKKPT